MNKVKFFYKYPINIDIETDKNVEVYIDEFSMKPVPDDVIRIVITDEPLKSELFYHTREHRDCYTYILTFHESILDGNPKAKLFHSSGSRPWVNNYIAPKKRFCVSTLVGGKDDPRMEGYYLRHNLWHEKSHITIPIDFYLSSHYKWKDVSYDGQKILGDSKIPLFDSQFHIAIENISIKDYFSEKVLDCFQSRTIPIYYGCLNIGDYFNFNGVIIVHNLREIIDVCNKLTPDTYERMLPVAENNFETSNKWFNWEERVKNAIIELI
jgi:hypothetical protein